jgi:redox-regulated HSP33 family molecular chaperone
MVEQMSEKSYKIELKCFFCDHILVSEENKKFQSGDLILCSNCNKGNDYDSLIEVAKEKGIELIKDDLNDYFKKTFESK